MSQTGRTRLQAPGPNTGGGGGGSTVIVAQNGVAQGTFTELDFHGATVTDEGGGIAEISIPASTGTSFVYRPGGVTGNGVYATWAELYTDFSSILVPGTIYIDDTLVSPAEIPIGAYNMVGATIESYSGDFSSNIQFDDGASFIFPAAFRNLIISSISSTPAINFTGSEGASIPLFFSCTPQPSGTAALISLNGASGNILAFYSCVIGPSTIDIEDTSFLDMLIFLGSNIDPTAVTGAVGASLNLSFDDTSGNAVSNFQTSFLGTQTLVEESRAEAVGYTPTNNNAWPPTPPTQAANALDQLALRTSFYNHTVTTPELVAGGFTMGGGGIPLPSNPPSVIVVYFPGGTGGAGSGVDVLFGTFYNITGGDFLTWTGLTGDGTVAAGDVFRIFGN